MASASRWPRQTTAVRIAAVVALPVAAVAALVPLRDHVLNANLALVLVLVVIAAAVLAGRWAAIAVGVVVALAFDFFLTRPYQSFSINNSEDVLTTALLALIGVVSGELVEWARRSQAQADARRLQIERHLRRAELASGGEEPGRLIARAQDELVDLLGVVDAPYRPGRPALDVAVLTHSGAYVPGQRAAADGEMMVLPVRAHGRDRGHFVLTFPEGTAAMSVPADRRHEAVAVADQLGAALLERERERV
jgi:K+-sensing histidine kinase KdpD